MNKTPLYVLTGVLPAIGLCALVAGQSQAGSGSDPLTTPNSAGLLRSFVATGAIDTTNPFFQSLGTNGRSCATCHVAGDDWTITPEHVRERFEATGGTDPIFRTVDGSNSPLADVSTVAERRKAYSMLLNKGLIRVGIGIPANAEFDLANVDDPYGFASARELSLFRRPMPSTNLRFLTGVMWDGRETVQPLVPPMDAGQNKRVLVESLKQQIVDATLGHAQASSPPTEAQVEQILAFEMGLTTAQVFDKEAGFLNDADGMGGPRILAGLQCFVGMNDTLGADPTGASFDPVSMSLFSAWQDTPAEKEDNQKRRKARQAVARGEKLFNTKTFQITRVGGLNDALNVAAIPGTCTTCHNSPNVGNHSVTLPINIGISDASRRTPDMPLYTLRNKTTGATIQTTDPGRALVTGKWKDIGKFKGPVLRGLAARAPYFHDGSIANLETLVDFYDTRFNIGMTTQEKSDLLAFLRSL